MEKGIIWLKDEQPSSFESVPMVSYLEETCAKNYKRNEKIFNDIILKFQSRNKQLFNDAVMQNWQAWLDQQRLQWDLNSKQASSMQQVHIPATYLQRVPSPSFLLGQEEEIEDCAFADVDDSAETVTFDSGPHGKFTQTDRLNLVRTSLFYDKDELKKQGPVLEKSACLYKYEYPVHLNGKTEMHKQVYVGVGIVEKVHGDPASDTATFDIRFCPPKGAKHETAKKPDMLYQNINT